MLSDESHPPRRTPRKQRACLCCAKVFESAWVGERICPHCKNSTVWREDLAGSSANHARYGSKNRRPGPS
jgi:hypothetical protein